MGDHYLSRPVCNSLLEECHDFPFLPGNRDPNHEVRGLYDEVVLNVSRSKSYK